MPPQLAVGVDFVTINFDSMKKYAAVAVFVSFACLGNADAKLLFDRFLAPDNSDYYFWNGYNPDTGVRGNPWVYASGAPNEGEAGYIGYGPESTPTITQLNPLATIPTSGRIYSFVDPLEFVLESSAPSSQVYADGIRTVGFQLETVGVPYDVADIKLVFTSGGTEYSLSASEYITEYQYYYEAGRGFSLGNRIALEWDLSGFDVSSYSIVWGGKYPHSSLTEVHLDNSPESFSLAPAKGTWTSSGTKIWSDAGNWEGGSLADSYGNVNFDNQSGAADVVLDVDRTVGELNFQTGNDVVIRSENGKTLSLNSGINTKAEATGNYTIGSAVELASYGRFVLEAGTVTVSGDISGDYGFLKEGSGRLVLSGSNSFGAGNPEGIVGLWGGTLRMEGINQYGGQTQIVSGTLEIAGNALNNVAGALGNSSAAIILGGDEDTYSHMGGLDGAALLIDGDYTVAREIQFGDGSHQKSIVAANTDAGAVVSGAVILKSTGARGGSKNVHFTTTAAGDTLTFSGNVSGGTAANTVTIDGLGTVIFSGSEKKYQSSTVVSSGILKLATGTLLSGTGNMTVGSGAKLVVSGTLGAGSGALLTLNSGAQLGGNGSIQREFTVGNGAILAPGESIGKLSTVGQTWVDGGVLQTEIGSVAGGFGIGWDAVEITGSLEINLSGADAFVIQLLSLKGDGTSGIVSDFHGNTNYSWTLLTTTAGITGFDDSRFTINTDLFLNAFDGIFSIGLSGDEKDLVLTYTAVPEPSTYALIGVGLAGYLVSRRRAQRAKTA